MLSVLVYAECRTFAKPLNNELSAMCITRKFSNRVSLSIWCLQCSICSPCIGGVGVSNWRVSLTRNCLIGARSSRLDKSTHYLHIILTFIQTIWRFSDATRNSFSFRNCLVSLRLRTNANAEGAAPNTKATSRSHIFHIFIRFNHTSLE